MLSSYLLQVSRKSFIWHQRGDFSLCRGSRVLEYQRQILPKSTVNFLNIRTPKIFVVITLKIWTMWLYHRVMSPNDADGMANSVDPDQTASLGAVWSGSALFAQTCLVRKLRNVAVTSNAKTLAEWLENLTTVTSSPKGNDRSPESNVPRSNLISKNSNSSKL